MQMLKTVTKIVQILEASTVSYTVIGGIAVLLHGCRASTIDLDLYVVSTDLPALKSDLLRNGATMELDSLHQLRFDFENIKIDVLEADEVLAADIFQRSVRKKIGDVTANIASVEDLIILKTLADRPVDRRDVEELREVFGDQVDQSYIHEKLNAFHSL